MLWQQLTGHVPKAILSSPELSLYNCMWLYEVHSSNLEVQPTKAPVFLFSSGLNFIPYDIDIASASTM